MTTETKLTIAVDLTQQVLDFASLAPERKRDGGSSMISMLDMALRHKQIKIIDLSDLRFRAAQYPGARCIECGQPIPVGTVIAFAQQASGVGVTFCKPCLGK